MREKTVDGVDLFFVKDKERLGSNVTFGGKFELYIWGEFKFWLLAVGGKN